VRSPEPTSGSNPEVPGVDRRVTPGVGIEGTPERPSATTLAAVVKLGGRSLEAPGALRELARELSDVSGGVLLVHGGGTEVSAWSARLGLVPRFEDGLRVTDADTLDVAAAVLGGLANKRLVAGLRHAGIDAIGLSALDGGIVAAAPHDARERLGAVGRVDHVRADRLRGLLALGMMPVIASIGAHEGALLNLNADDVATAVAAALPARALVLLSDTPGVRLAGAWVPALDLRAVDRALAGPDVAGGMRAKLSAAREALQHGVARVHIATWNGPGTLRALLSDAPPGTVLTPNGGAPRMEVTRV
jgi:acetylglutamate kinase